MSSSRPDSVPETATHNAKNDEWELGALRDDGKKDGTWKYWAKSGYLICQSSYADGKLKTYRRYHPNGEVAEEGAMDDTGRIHEQAWGIATADGSPEQLPSILFPVPPGTRRVVKVPGSMPVTFRYLDAHGQELDSLGKPIAAQAGSKATCLAFADAPQGETASAAVDRYAAFMAALADAKGISPSDPFLAEHALIVGARVDLDALRAVEERREIRFPASYVELVTRRGLVGFGKGETARLFDPSAIVSVRDWYEENEYAPEQLEEDFGADDDALALWARAIGFSRGDEKGQIVAMYCFRYDTGESEASEPTVHAFNHEAPEAFGAPAGRGRGTFDEHMSALVSQQVRSVVARVF